MTGVSLLQLMFGRDPKQVTFPPTNAFDSSFYSAYLLAKLAKFQDFVATNINTTAAAQQQKNHYDKDQCYSDFFSWGTSMAFSAYSRQASAQVGGELDSSRN